MFEKLNPYEFFKINPKKSLVYNYWAAFYRAVLDYIFEGFSYHAAAISFYTLMSFFPLLLFLTVGVSYIISDKTDIVISALQKLFPQITQQFLKLLLTLVKKRTAFGFFGLIISFYFASSIFTSLHSAFTHIFDNREEGIKKKALIYFFGVPVFTVILITIYLFGLFISSILSIMKSFELWKYFENILGFVHLKFLIDILTDVGLIVQSGAFILILYILYKFLAPHNISNWKIIFSVSLIISILLLILSILFNKYIIFASKANPVYGALSGIFAFLAWLYFSYGIIIIGGRMLYYLEKLET